MSYSPQAAREQRNALAKEVRNLLDNNPGATWKPEHQKQYDEKTQQIVALDEELARHQRILDLEGDKLFADITGGKSVPGASADSPAAVRAYRAWLKGGDAALKAAEFDSIRNTMSTTTGSEGGFTVPTEIAQSIADALKAYGGVRKVASIIQTAAGNDLNFPNSDGTSETGELIGQNTTATAADPVFGSTTLSCYKYSSKIIAVPFELMQDSVVNMEQFIAQRIATRLGRITNTHFTTGTGSGQPKGVVTAAGSGKVGTTGQTLTVIYNDLVDLVHSVDPAYRELGNCRFMMNDSSIKVIRKLVDGSSRPIWTPSYDAGIKGAVPDTLLGYPVQVNQDVAVMAANAKSILFGDFTFYYVRDAMAMNLFRFTDSAYTKLGQVAFLAWMRSGGTYIDVGGGLKYYQNSAT